MKIILQAINTIEKHALLQRGDKILAGLSGGADSVCLLHILKSISEMYNISIYAAHVNHNIRDTADRDMEYSMELCDKLGIECFVKSVDVFGYMQENKTGTEDAARKLRYDFFDEICREYNIDKIATAHNLNDRAETVLMNFIRGSGLGGLGGIPYRRGNIIRPVMDLSREETERYCRENRLEFMTDETNFEKIYTRNKIRLDVIPYIQENINKNFIRRIVENSDIIIQEDDFMKQCAGEVFSQTFRFSGGKYMLDISGLDGCHAAVVRRVMQMYFHSIYNDSRNLGKNFADAALRLMQGQSGKSIDLPDNVVLKNEYGYLTAEKKSADYDNEEYAAGNYRIIKEYGAEAQKPDKNRIFIKTEFAGGLSLRYRKDGDYFYPYGMEGGKKLKKFFSDMKIPKEIRGKIPILVSEKDEIVWVVGMRADRRFAAEIGERSVKIQVKSE